MYQLEPTVCEQAPDDMPSIPLHDLADFFPGLSQFAGQLAPRSVKQYSYDIQYYLAFCCYDMQRVWNPQSLRLWRQSMVDEGELSPWTINRRLAAVRKAVKASAAMDEVDHALAYRFSLVERVSSSSLRHRIKHRGQGALTVAEMRRLLRAPDASTLVGLRDRAFLHLLAGTGCRIHEVLAMRRDQIQVYGESYVIMVLGKGQAEPRPAPLTREAFEWVERWINARAQHGCHTPWLVTGFVNNTGRLQSEPLTYTPAWRRIKMYGERVGLPKLTPHDFRKFVGTQISKRDGLRAAQLALGHSRIDTTAAHYDLNKLPEGLTDGLI